MTASRNFYSQPSYMNGGSYTIYSGSRRQQRGGGLLGSFKNLIAPIGRRAMATMKKVVLPTVISGVKRVAQNKTVQNVAKAAAKRGTEALGNVVLDALKGENVKTAIKERAKEATLGLLADESKPPKKAATKNLRQNKRQPPPQVNKTIRAKKYRRLSRARLNRKNLF